MSKKNLTVIPAPELSQTLYLPEPEWLRDHPFLALDPRRQPKFSLSDHAAAESGWANWEYQKKASRV
jgi:hypothetical protein